MSLDSASSQKDASGAPAAGPMHQVMGRRWMVAAGHPLAAQAAARILEAGGNAIDAGCAAGMMLGVVHPDMVSFAGVAPASSLQARHLPSKTGRFSRSSAACRRQA